MIDEEARRVRLRPFGSPVPIARFSRELMQAQPGEAAGLSRSFGSLVEGGGDVSLHLLWRVGSALGLPVVEVLDPDCETEVGIGEQRR